MRILLFPFILLLGIFVTIIVTFLAVVSLPFFLICKKESWKDSINDWQEVFGYLYYIIYWNVFKYD